MSIVTPMALKCHSPEYERPRCQNDACEPHTCPYLVDVHEGEPGCDRLCMCCDECTQSCAEDI